MLKLFLKQNANDVLFYRNSYRRFTKLAIALLVLNFALLGLLFWKQLNIVIPPDFATTSDGRVINIEPMK